MIGIQHLGLFPFKTNVNAAANPAGISVPDAAALWWLPQRWTLDLRFGDAMFTGVGMTQDRVSVQMVRQNPLGGDMVDPRMMIHPKLPNRGGNATFLGSAEDEWTAGGGQIGGTAKLVVFPYGNYFPNAGSGEDPVNLGSATLWLGTPSVTTGVHFEAYFNVTTPGVESVLALSTLPYDVSGGGYTGTVPLAQSVLVYDPPASVVAHDRRREETFVLNWFSEIEPEDPELFEVTVEESLWWQHDFWPEQTAGQVRPALSPLGLPWV